MTITHEQQVRQIAEFVMLTKQFVELRHKLYNLHERRMDAGFYDATFYTDQMLQEGGVGHLTKDELMAANNAMIAVMIFPDNPMNGLDGVAPIKHIMKVIP